MTARNYNARVTVAVLGTKIDAVQATLEEIKALAKGHSDDIGALREEDARLDGRINRLDDRISSWRGIQAAISAALAAVAGYVGTRN